MSSEVVWPFPRFLAGTCACTADQCWTNQVAVTLFVTLLRFNQAPSLTSGLDRRIDLIGAIGRHVLATQIHQQYNCPRSVEGLVRLGT